MHFTNLNSIDVDAPAHLFSNLEITLSCSAMALTGPNGGGKSTLLKLIYHRCQQAGVDVVYGPQHPDPAALSEGQNQIYRWLDWMERGLTANSVLLLDEPFRHLDMDFRSRAMDFLKQIQGYALIVSHDLDFLGEVETIYHLQSGVLQFYGGGYQTYASVRKQQAEAREKRISSLQSTIQKVQKAGQKIQHRQEHRTRKAQKDNLKQNIPRSLINKQKGRAQKTAAKLEKQTRRKAQANDERLNQTTDELLSVQRDTGGIVHIPAGNVRKSALDTVGFAPTFRGRQDSSNHSISLGRKERIWIQGPNGAGKSSFIRAILGLHPFRGAARLGGTVFYLSQSLNAFERSGSLESAFSDLWTLCCPAEPVPNQNILSQWRTLLGYSGIRGDDFHRSLSSFSGGERMRILLCLAAVAEPALLLLDEPEQNLDLVAREELLASLNDYSGAIMFVSHDAIFAQSLNPDSILEIRR